MRNPRSTCVPLIVDREPVNYVWHDDDGQIILEEDGSRIFIDNAVPVLIGNPPLVARCRRPHGGTKTIGVPQFVEVIVNPADLLWRDDDRFKTVLQENDGAIMVIDNS